MKFNKRSQSKIKWALLGTFFAFAVLHVIAVKIDRSAEAAWLKTFAMNFDLDREKVLPAFYTSLLLAGSGFLAIKAAKIEKLKRRKSIWWGMGLGFMYLALDEFFIIHEQLAEPIRKLLEIDNQSIFYHAWVVPAIAFVVIGIGVTVFALRHHLLSKSQIAIIYLILLLIIIDVALESLGTKFYNTQTIYRYGTVMAEELFEMGMISYILYRLYGVNAETKQLK